jgi:hypothetical protein
MRMYESNAEGALCHAECLFLSFRAGI